MSIVDEKILLTQEEFGAYRKLLKLQHFEQHHFLIEVTENQEAMDMNDINYIIFLKVQVTHVQTDISNIYFSQWGLGTWISEFEDDLQNKYFKN